MSCAQKGWTDGFAIWVVDSRWPKEAQVQLYSPAGANVPTWEDTLAPPGKYENMIEPSIGGDAVLLSNYFDHLFLLQILIDNFFDIKKMNMLYIVIRQDITMLLLSAFTNMISKDDYLLSKLCA